MAHVLLWIDLGTANPDCDPSEAIRLRASRKRLRPRAAEQRDELAPLTGLFLGDPSLISDASAATAGHALAVSVDDATEVTHPLPRR